MSPIDLHCMKEYSCRDCYALPGEHCIYESGSRMNKVHAVRMEGWNRKYDEKYREFAAHERFAVGGLG